LSKTLFLVSLESWVLMANSFVLTSADNFTFPAETTRSFKIQKTGLGNGRFKLECAFSKLSVVVLAIPAEAITPEEKLLLNRTRDSYRRMWGTGFSQVGESEDVFDGYGANSAYYKTFHYIATAAYPAKVTKIFTMRKVSLKPAFDITVQPFFDELTIWKTVNRFTGQEEALWERLKKYLASPKPETAIATINRMSTYPYGEDLSLSLADKLLYKDFGAIAHALLQIAAFSEAEEELCFCTMCSELEEKFTTFNSQTGKLKLAFQRTANTLNIAPTGQLVLDNNLREVRHLKLNYPGYWLDNEQAAKVFEKLLNQGLLNLAVLLPILKRIKGTDKVEAEQAENGEIARFLTNSRNFKYLIPLLNSDEAITAGLSGAELREQLLAGGGDGPFSCAFKPAQFVQSGLNLLQEAYQKYRNL
jgi:hypothetical protein